MENMRQGKRRTLRRRQQLFENRFSDNVDSRRVRMLANSDVEQYVCWLEHRLSCRFDNWRDESRVRKVPMVCEDDGPDGIHWNVAVVVWHYRHCVLTRLMNFALHRFRRWLVRFASYSCNRNVS